MSIIVRHRIGGWLPRNHRILQHWLAKKIAQVAANPQPFQPVIQEFQDLIESDAEIYMAFHQTFDQVPTKPPYDNDPTGKPQVRDYMLGLFNQILTEAPNFDESDYEVGLVGFPINAILDWPMGTCNESATSLVPFSISYPVIAPLAPLFVPCLILSI
ncbi:Phophatidylserine decarboxylase-domain-containing protein [Desarmillaria ectypa]|nr:Phophatidylserine decarboxylase-domain-containing protein [Desarmillaria ectypa]